MSLFSKEPKKEVKKEKKYCEVFTVFSKTNEEIEDIISERLKEGKIIKDVCKIKDSGLLIIYDYEAEEKRREEELEKQNSKDAWTQKLDNDKNNSNGWER